MFRMLVSLCVLVLQVELAWCMQQKGIPAHARAAHHAAAHNAAAHVTDDGSLTQAHALEPKTSEKRKDLVSAFEIGSTGGLALSELTPIKAADKTSNSKAAATAQQGAPPSPTITMYSAHTCTDESMIQNIILPVGQDYSGPWGPCVSAKSGTTSTNVKLDCSQTESNVYLFDPTTHDGSTCKGEVQEHHVMYESFRDATSDNKDGCVPAKNLLTGKAEYMRIRYFTNKLALPSCTFSLNAKKEDNFFKILVITIVAVLCITVVLALVWWYRGKEQRSPALLEGAPAAAPSVVEEETAPSVEG